MYIKLKGIFFYYYIMLGSIKTATTIIYISNIYIYIERELHYYICMHGVLLWTEVGHHRNLTFVISRVSEDTSTTSQTVLRFPKIPSLQSKISIWTRSFLDKWFELLCTIDYMTIDSLMSYSSSGVLGETERRLMLAEVSWAVRESVCTSL